MAPRGRRGGRLIPWFVATFYAGGLAGWLLHATFAPPEVGPGAAPVVVPDDRTGVKPDAEVGQASEEEIRLKPDPTAESSVGTAGARIGADPVAALHRRDLLVPIEGMDVARLKGSFAERRGASRRHEAVDILAPRNTPIRAVDDGRIAKLFRSAGGGITIYHFDPAERFCYYYAHLERYAAGLGEGDRIRRGQVIGYVGTTGNAPPDTPHLHFAVYELGPDKRWSGGEAIDPYLVFSR